MSNDLEKAEGAQGEQDLFKAWWSSSGLTKFKDTAQAAWEARAALAQPSPAPELERPEVVAYVGCSAKMTSDGWENGDEYLAFAEEASDADKRYDVPLMTVAQHERIVGALREKIDGAESQAEYQTRRAEHFAKERDAVLSRLAELEKQAPVAAVSEETFSADGTSDIITRNLPIGTKLYAAPIAAQAQPGQVPEDILITWRGFWLEEQISEMVQTLARLRDVPGVDDRALVMAIADAGQCKARALTMADLLAAMQVQGGRDE